MRAIDLFSGGGGSSWGARLAGVKVVGAFDLCPTAKSVYQDNFPEVHFFGGRIENRSATALAEQLGKIDLIIASPECTNHGPAKGAKERCEKSRETAFEVTRFARAFRPRWVVIENAVGMKSWTRYPELISRLEALDYIVSEQTVNAADCGVPQNRRRLFILCDRKATPPSLRFDSDVIRTAGDIVDRRGDYAFSLLRAKERAKATLARAENAISELGTKEAFLLVYYGTDQAGGWKQYDGCRSRRPPGFDLGDHHSTFQRPRPVPTHRSVVPAGFFRAHALPDALGSRHAVCERVGSVAGSAP